MIEFLKYGLIIAIAIIAYLMWQFQTNNKKEILSYGEVTAQSRYGNPSIKSKTRKVRQGHLEYEEVYLGGKVWVDCAGDCMETLRIEKVDWKESEEERRR